MIIKPQINNLRLINVALLASIIALVYFSYQSSTSLDEYHDFLLSEKTSIEKELNELYTYYDDIDIENQELHSKLDDYKIKLNSVLEDIKNTDVDVKTMSQYKEQLQLLKEENARILKLVDKLNAENEFLRQETLSYETKLVKSIVESDVLKSKNSDLSSINNSLNKKIDEAFLFRIYLLKVLNV